MSDENRPELAELEAMLRTEEIDLLICDDLGRIVRGTDAERLIGLAVECGTRVIAINDGIDTNDETWEEDVISACRDHVGHQAHTSKRIKQKMQNRFLRNGGATARETFGYIKPEGAKTYDEWRKNDSATPIYQEWFERLRQNGNCSAVADWLNEKGVPVGKYCRRKSKKWDGKMVRRITRNTMLKGVVGRGYHHTVKHHATGRRVSVPNPNGPDFKEFPHLAHIEAALWDEVNTKLNANNKKLGRKPDNGKDPLLGVPRKRTRFPGQHAHCWYCGRQMVWGANGMVGNLMCNGARQWQCWNPLVLREPWPPAHWSR